MHSSADTSVLRTWRACISLARQGPPSPMHPNRPRRKRRAKKPNAGAQRGGGEPARPSARGLRCLEELRREEGPQAGAVSRKEGVVHGQRRVVELPWEAGCIAGSEVVQMVPEASCGQVGDGG